MSAHQEKGVGENPPHGAIIYYNLKEKPKKPITIEVLDAENKRVIFIDGKDGKKEEPETDEDKPLEPRRPEVPAEAGVNRFVWDLSHAGADIIPKARLDGGNPTIGPLVSPGIYKVKVTIDGKVLSGNVEVLMDPRIKEPRGSLAAIGQGAEILEIAPRVADSPAKGKPSLSLKLSPTSKPPSSTKRSNKRNSPCRCATTSAKLSGLVAQVRSIRKQIDLQAELLADDAKAKPLLKEDKALAEKLDALEARLHNPKAEVTYDILAMKGGAKLYSQLAMLLDFVTAGDGPPTQGMVERAAELKRELEIYEVQFDRLKQEELAKINGLAQKLQAPMIWIPKRSRSGSVSELRKSMTTETRIARCRRRTHKATSTAGSTS